MVADRLLAKPGVVTVDIPSRFLPPSGGNARNVCKNMTVVEQATILKLLISICMLIGFVLMAYTAFRLRQLTNKSLVKLICLTTLIILIGIGLATIPFWIAGVEVSIDAHAPFPGSLIYHVGRMLCFWLAALVCMRLYKSIQESVRAK